MARKKRRKNKLLTKSYIDRYLNKNLEKAIRKLKRMETTGSYMASEKAQEAKASLRSLYRKYGLTTDIYHKGKKFRENLKSLNDLNVLYRAVFNLMSINTTVERRKLKNLQDKYEKEGINFNSMFDTLSKLSSEFHEVFAFITYNEAQSMLVDNKSQLDILSQAFNVVEDKYLNDKQTEQFSRLKGKLYKNFKPNEILHIMKGDYDEEDDI